MDRLKQSLQDRPNCPNCGVKMQLYRSELVKFVPEINLHLFNCPTCVLFAESETVHEAVSLAPDGAHVSGFRFIAVVT
jgi:hypothetical protein